MMSRYLQIVTAFGVLAAWSGIAAAAGPEAVTNFAQTASLSSAGSLSVTDEIDYDFGGTPPHGVEYKIPVSYHDDQGREFRMKFGLVGAKSGGQTVSVNPDISAAAAILTFPGGTAAVTTRHYSLRYTLEPVVLRGTSSDNLKLSVTGLGWAVPVNKASLNIDTQKAIADNLTCYTGTQGGTTGACTVTQTGKSASIISYAPLQPGESLSIFADYPSGSFGTYLEAYEEHPATLGGLIMQIILGIIGVVALVFIFASWRRRRSRRIVGSAPSDYTNANETPKGQAHRK